MNFPQYLPTGVSKYKYIYMFLCSVSKQAGDADTNGAVAGALLGCKLGYSHIAEFSPNWLFQLRYKDWYDQKIRRYD